MGSRRVGGHARCQRTAHASVPSSDRLTPLEKITAESFAEPPRGSRGLPVQPGQLIGRAAEVALVQRRLMRDDVRLLTLVGPAGTGKTRLAVEVARRSSDAFDDGAAFVDLSPLTDADLVASAIAQSLALNLTRDRPLLELLTDQLARRHMLLVLD